jgi:carbon storage regulator
MLVLTRRIGEEIVIDGNIRITITSVRAGKVRIGISAPDSVLVDRREVHHRRSEFAPGLPKQVVERTVHRPFACIAATEE